MNLDEIFGQINAIKSSIDLAFDEGKIDFDAIALQLDALKSAIGSLHLGNCPKNESIANTVNAREYR